MGDLQQYVPTVTTRKEYELFGSDLIMVTVDDFHPILFGTDEKLFCVHKYIVHCVNTITFAGGIR